MAPDVLFNASLFCFPLRRPYSPQASLIIAMWFFFFVFPRGVFHLFFFFAILGTLWLCFGFSSEHLVLSFARH